MSDQALYRRENLYEEVWAEPVRTVASRYGVSDVALAKACRRLKVPLPGVGYWAKKKVEKAPDRPPLAELSPEEQAKFEWSNFCRVQQRRQQGRPMVAPRTREEVAPKLEVKVEERLMRPHQLVVDARQLLRQPGPRAEFPPFPERPCLDIDVSRGSLSRALRIMDALLKALESQGYEVENTASARTTSYYNQSRFVPGVTRARVGEDWINFGLSENCTWIEVHRPLEWAKEWGGYSLDRVRRGAGEFSLFATNAPPGLRKTWKDGKKQRVEDCLGAFVLYLPLIAERLKEERLEAGRRHQAWREEERRREEAAARRKKDERRRKELEEALAQWRLARDIRAFVAEVKRRAGAAKLGDGLGQRLEWSLAYADSVDPIPDLVDAQVDDVRDN